MKLHKFTFNTIIKKSILFILSFIIIIILMTELLHPYLFEQIVAPNIYSTAAGVIEGVSVRLSYILANHNNAARRLCSNEELAGFIREYYDSPSDGAKDKVNSKLAPRWIGQSERSSSGPIFSSSYLSVVSEYGDIFCQDDIAGKVDMVVDSEWYRSLVAAENYTEYLYYCYSPVFTDDTDSFSHFYTFAVFFEVDGISFYLLMLIDFDDFLIQCHQLDNLGVSDFYVMAHEDRILYSGLEQGPLYNIEEGTSVGEQYEVRTSVHQDTVNFHVLYSYPEEGISLFVIAEKDILFSSYKGIFQIYNIALYGILIVYMAYVILVIRRYMKRIVRLSNRMEQVKNLNYDVFNDDTSSDEIGKLSKMFNLMVSKTQSNIKEIIKQKKREQDIQYSLAISEIDPHFIYNTLYTSNYLADQNRNEEVIEVNNALISILKDRLKIKNFQSFDTAENEIKLLRKYILIQSYLVNYKIELAIDVKKELSGTKIPKNILQPIVENSIIHGLLLRKDLQGNGENIGVIRVSLTKADRTIHLTIEDNGVGMDEETIQRCFFDPVNVSPTKEDNLPSIGVRNIRMRLQYLYNDQFTIKVESVINEGTKIHVYFPDSVQ